MKRAALDSVVDYFDHSPAPELIEARNEPAMQTTRLTRSSVLGKRAHQQQESPTSPVVDKQLHTPDSTPNPKRVRTASTVIDGEANKENVPPFIPEIVSMEVSTPRTARSLRRTVTELITPTRARPPPRRYASISLPGTPTGEISHLAIATPPPTPPTSILPLHARARALLRSTCNNTDAQIAGRDTERATIQTFLASFLDISDVASDPHQSTCLYISGAPGTGKTALVNAVLRETKMDAKVIFINCMALNSVDALWERLVDELDDSRKKSTGRTKKVKGRDAVESLIACHNIKCVVILDELDHITPTTQSLTSLFSLPNSKPSSIRLIGIANTHTLTSSSSSTSSITAASNVHTLHFAPYTPTQLLQILQSRLQPLYVEDSADEGKAAAAAKKFLPAPTLTLLTKKVAALTGDVRSLFEVLRGAIDQAATGTASPNMTLPTVEENPLNSPAISVTPSHILAALKAYAPSSTSTTKAATPAKASTDVSPATTNSEIVSKVTGLGIQARLVLLSVLLASRRIEANLPINSGNSVTSTPKKTPATPTKRSSSLITNGVGIDSTQLYTYYGAVLDRCDGGAFEPVSRSEFTDLVGVLEGIGLVCLGAASNISAGTGARRAFGRTSSFGGGSGFGGTGKGKGMGDVRLANGVRSDEVLRGLGITAAQLDVREEEVKAIWERENARLARDLKAIEREKERAAAIMNGFEDASED
ncbi:hypothetical protein H0H81_011351 [Sphagnurus paluster]|uniref:AAA+ ATPase domain-containing protein n=1 Tax=Sphagnurus paluster TaxID=117069 RepID=A0A9P7G0P9_9AGAR|nr:hypothetical protein H0H81_011351 [Sphagnurus paluster]